MKHYPISVVKNASYRRSQVHKGPSQAMKDVGRYLQAGTRENTRRSYQSAIDHFEVTWGGFLPATGDSVVRYLVDYADTLSVNTLKQRLAALAQWGSRDFPSKNDKVLWRPRRLWPPEGYYFFRDPYLGSV